MKPLFSLTLLFCAGRLTGAEVVHPNLVQIPPPQTVGYGGGSADNIVEKSDIGQFKYLSRQHILSYTNNAVSQISTLKQQVAYTPFHRPDSLMENDWELRFQYGPDYERRRTDLYKLGTLTETRHYFGSGSERHEDLVNNTTRDLFYIPGPDGVAAIIKKEGRAEQVYFPYADHIGTMTALTDVNGNIVCRQAFDPWSAVESGQPYRIW